MSQMRKLGTIDEDDAVEQKEVKKPESKKKVLFKSMAGITPEASPRNSHLQRMEFSATENLITPSLNNLQTPIGSPFGSRPMGSFSLNDSTWLNDIAEEMLQIAKEQEELDKKDCAFVPDENRVENMDSLFIMTDEIGSGATSRVVLAQHIASQEYVALKQLRKDDETNLDTFENEARILSNLEHENIACLYDCYIDKFNYYIATQYCKGGNLVDCIRKFDTFSEKQATIYLKTIIDVISYCHGLNIVHRDLKPGNLVFQSSPHLEIMDNMDAATTGGEVEMTSKAKLMIIDFGIAIEIQDTEDNDEYVGTLVYMPPESCSVRSGLELKYGDMWSIGVIAYILVSGKIPFKGKNQKEMIVSIMKDNIEWPNNIDLSDNCKDFISRLLEKDPMYRMNANEALDHVWITDDTQTPNTNLGDGYKQNIAKFDHTVTFNHLMKDATLSKMTKDDKNMVKSGMSALNILPDDVIDKEFILKYLEKLGMDKKKAELRASAIANVLCGSPSNGLIPRQEYHRVSKLLYKKNPNVMPNPSNMKRVSTMAFKKKRKGSDVFSKTEKSKSNLSSRFEKIDEQNEEEEDIDNKDKNKLELSPAKTSTINPRIKEEEEEDKPPNTQRQETIESIDAAPVRKGCCILM